MRARVGSSDLTILVGAAVLMAILAVVSFLLSPVDSSPRAPGSSYSAEPNGTKAAYLVLKALGRDVQRSFEPISSLRLDPSGTVLVVVNPIMQPSKGDQRAMRAFVEGGGVVLAFGLSAEPFLPEISVRGHRGEESIEPFPAALPSRLTRGVAEISARRSPAPSLGNAYVPVYGRADNLAVVEARLGAGRIIWGLDRTLIQNDGITRPGNVAFLANAVGVAGPRTIAWDEHYHGERRSFWSYLAGTPLVWGMAQLGVAAIAIVAGVSRRRGPVRARAVEPRTSPLEFIDTMASLYERAGDPTAAVESARTRLRRRLATLAGMAISTTDAQLVMVAAPRIGLDPDRTRAALSAAAHARRHGVLKNEEAVPIVAELQELNALAGERRRESGVRQVTGAGR